MFVYIKTALVRADKKNNSSFIRWSHFFPPILSQNSLYTLYYIIYTRMLFDI